MKILVLTSGGDAPGMNRFVYNLSRKFKDCYYSYGGFKGLCENKIYPLGGVITKAESVKGGSVIKSMRYPQFLEEKYFKKAVKKAKEFDYVVILGGNGSEKGAKSLCENGVNVLFVPATVDNDVDRSVYSIGFSSAIFQCVYVVNNSLPSFYANNRACVYIVMGNESSAIVKEVGKRVCADIVLSGKEDIDYSHIGKTILNCVKNDRGCCIVMKEKLVDLKEFSKKLLEKVKDETLFRFQEIGYLQRGGDATQMEIKLVDRLFKKAVELIKNKSESKKIFLNDKLQAFDIPFED